MQHRNISSVAQLISGHTCVMYTDYNNQADVAYFTERCVISGFPVASLIDDWVLQRCCNMMLSYYSRPPLERCIHYQHSRVMFIPVTRVSFVFRVINYVKCCAILINVFSINTFIYCVNMFLMLYSVIVSAVKG